ncbi:rod shape-determining protein MreD [Actibacterium sp. XHP0104]|uniref:rod shape-determining protein MreD n=1 Tax=Actibacterium sp. XHP0104 TaxID=2984335 RepID=UPI0021E7F4B1|nr:rod shape-determining protein MreD [Actibacterium sp. XHP0104]MCV2880436.1 rod shape-determining protein MreD [Actibacterium sp. XHP0104]
MIDPVTSQRWVYRLIFVALAGLVTFVQILPLQTAPTRVPGPDLLLCLAFGYVQRRPDYAPVLLMTLVFLLSDFLLMRPPGLWTALVLLGAEFLRNRQAGSGEVPFPAEWLLTGAAIFAVYTLNVLLLAMTGTPAPARGMMLVQAVLTVACYPLVVGLLHYGLNLRRTAPGGIQPRGALR